MTLITPRAFFRGLYGQPVVSGEAGSLVVWKLSTTRENLPVVIRGRYRTAAAHAPPRVGSDDWLVVRQSPSHHQPFYRQGHAGFLNLGGAYGLHSLLSSLRKFLQEPRGVLSVLSRPCLSVRFIHASKHGASDVEKIRFPSGEIRNVVG
jgi:hypothetical protein